MGFDDLFASATAAAEAEAANGSGEEAPAATTATANGGDADHFETEESSDGSVQPPTVRRTVKKAPPARAPVDCECDVLPTPPTPNAEEDGRRSSPRSIKGKQAASAFVAGAANSIVTEPTTATGSDVSDMIEEECRSKIILSKIFSFW